MKKLLNDRGSALVYVLMLLMALGIFSPVLLKMVSTQTLATNKAEYEKKVTQYLYGAMDTFIAYLEAYSTPENPSLDPIQHAKDYFENYPRRSEKVTNIELPDGDTLLYSFKYKPTSNVKYKVTMTVIAGELNPNEEKDEGERFYVKKELEYVIDLETIGGSNFPIGSLEGDSNNFKRLSDAERENRIQQFKPTKFDYGDTNDIKTFKGLEEAMNKALVRKDKSQFTFKLSLDDRISTSTNLNFSTAKDKVFIIYVTQVKNGQDVLLYNTDKPQNKYHEHSLLTLNKDVNWNFRGMLIINGNLNNENSVTLNINNVLVNGSFFAYGVGNSRFNGFYEVRKEYLDGKHKGTGKRESGDFYKDIPGDDTQVEFSSQRK
ncbi:hypothetical protein BEP19_05510 [Ammoniphilus oxalaticus]|uniref:Uncharacterized protein n=1 Tax=Ammoniphilus oxalaticus TaxID=66863 RepID=A0A419SIL9_9BACL|nr:hypothetical protein [Ammoniphilus oxalaticus]RKD23884.1 hypothetical protein BEP19_05510 [Ammoniphilus oxalaticus]